MTETPIIHINGKPSAQISALDRGFAYGDGFFETCYLYNNKIHLWDLHLERLRFTARRLAINLDEERLNFYIREILQEKKQEVSTLKIQITRGESQRGYAFADDLPANYALFLSAGNSMVGRPWLDGIKTRVCDLRVATHPALAGLKHLNRLENILARAEWKNEFAEGLLLDQQDYLIEGTMSNIFIVKNSCLLTPDLHQAGVAGVMRKAIITLYAAKLAIPVKKTALTLDDLASADEAFICNSLIGIWPIVECAGKESLVFKPGEVTRQLQGELINHVTA